MDQPAINPEQALQRATSAFKAGRFIEAERLCEQIVAARPDFVDGIYWLGVVQARLGKNDVALATFDRALGVQSDFAGIHFSRANVLTDLERHEEAVASYDRAIELQPDFAMAHSNRGNLLQRFKRLEEAVASYDRAITLQPDYAVAYYNRGNALQDLKRYDEAVASYDRAIDIRPDFAEARVNQAISLLLIADFARGWQGYEWRTRVKSPGNVWRSFERPQWFGHEDLAGKTILLPAEQGFGDTIQFGRYVPLVAARGARVLLEVLPPLAELMASVAGAAQIMRKGDPLPDFDLQCPLLSLPLAFGTRLETLPTEAPYLHVKAEDAAQWDARLGAKTRPRIGLAWSGEPTHPNDRNRSIPLAALQPLLEFDATFVSLQKDIRASDVAVLQARGDLLHFGDSLTNFYDTAALVSNLDLVISIDSSVAHLAGALAKPVWILLPYNSDWRWLLNREDSPWYPTARLFRQHDLHAPNWDNVLARVQAALRDFLQGRS